ncbi:ABC transporter substrate-binding protein [Vreelandella titanicae]|uniref:ABC transporter substrate-binding protein n=1 Tax=Vreelandella titanicae TaxID=664683 RepID=UPI0039BF3A1C
MPGFTIALRLSFNSVAAMVVIAALTLPTKSLASSNAPTIAALDSRIVETLIAMELPPVAFTYPGSQYYLSNSSLSGSTNLGLASQPNLELLNQFSPQQILISPYLTQISAQLSSIAKVVSLTPYGSETSTGRWRQLTSFTRKLGKHIGDERASERLIHETKHRFQSLHDRIPRDQPPLLIISFIDHRHARVFGNNSMFQGALEQLELTNAWQGQNNHLGFTTASIDALIDIDARLIILESPYANSPVHEQFFAEGIWGYMRSLQRGDEIYLPATFSHFGALPSALVFSEALVEALEAQMGL